MGAKQLETAVADSGPLIHLTQIGSLAFLRLFAQIHVPQMVWSETVGKGRVMEKDIFILGNTKMEYPDQTEVIRFVKDNALEDLHAGERESLYVCQQTGVNLVLTDDLAVRKAAKRLKVTPVGSLGIVIRAYKAGLISLEEATQRISDLQTTSTLFVTCAIVELAIEELHRRVNIN